MSLVADYGTSSDSNSDSESDSDNQEAQNEEPPIERQCEKLPGPAFGAASTSVFSNPFIEAENAKKAILEKHVKMVPSKEDTRIINGKKICWNYRKGRCRFGHKCVFAHDSDLQKTAEELEEANRVQTTIICQNNGPISDENTQNSSSFEPQTDGVINKLKKKRPGLTQGLVPGKKVMKMFHHQKKTPKSF